MARRGHSGGSEDGWHFPWWVPWMWEHACHCKSWTLEPISLLLREVTTLDTEDMSKGGTLKPNSNTPCPSKGRASQTPRGCAQLQQASCGFLHRWRGDKQVRYLGELSPTQDSQGLCTIPWGCVQLPNLKLINLIKPHMFRLVKNNVTIVIPDVVTSVLRTVKSSCSELFAIYTWPFITYS